MDTFGQESAHITRGPRTAIFKALTREDRATHSRWARTVLASYGAFFVLGGIAILGSHSSSNSNNPAAQASLQKSSLTQAGR
jgi:hypothetical protein